MCQLHLAKLYNTLGATILSATLDAYRHLEAERPRLVVSLTTLPARVNGVMETVRSLLRQSVRPDRIYLNVPTASNRFKEARYVIPRALSELDKSVVIQRTTDLGPATKLIATLEKEADPNTLIITVDDDMVYGPSMVASLLEAHLLEPNAAYGFAGQLIDLDPCNRTAPWPAVCMSRVHVRSVDNWSDRHAAVDILEAFKGAIYRRDFFNLDRLKAIPESCLRTDDIWISANLALVGIPRVKLLTTDHPQLSANDKVSPLRKDNVHGVGQNDVCALELLDVFLATRNAKPSACPVRFQQFDATKKARGRYYNTRAYYNGHHSPCTEEPRGRFGVLASLAAVLSGALVLVAACRRSARVRTGVRRLLARSATLGALANRLASATGCSLT